MQAQCIFWVPKLAELEEAEFHNSDQAGKTECKELIFYDECQEVPPIITLCSSGTCEQIVTRRIVTRSTRCVYIEERKRFDAADSAEMQSVDRDGMQDVIL